MHGILLFASVLLQLVPTTLGAANSTCYFSNSHVADNDVPCDPDAEVSVCCSKTEGSICLENGLCSSSTGHKSRGSCTDQKWGSEWCPQFCLDTDSDDGVGMKSCSSVTKNDTSFCCWYSADSCCSSGVNRIELLPSNAQIWASYDNSSSSYEVVKSRTLVSSSTEASSSTTSSSSSSSATSATTATTTSSSSSPTATSDSSTQGSSELTTGAKAGIGIGVSLGVIALLALGFFINRWYEAKKREQAQALEQQHQHPGSPGKYSELASWGTSQPHSSPLTTPQVTPHSSPPYDPRYPAGPYVPPVEMPTRHTPAVEMPAN